MEMKLKEFIKSNEISIFLKAAVIIYLILIIPGFYIFDTLQILCRKVR
jgi:hypothetical protein